jgi:AcrR family transcriptional regulator
MSEASKPRGRDSVRAALIASGAQLFAERGPSAVSVRDVARAAGVNHGLVHRHFGSKRGLLKAVMTELTDQIAAEVGEPKPDETLDEFMRSALAVTGGVGLHWRILARALLDGEDPSELQGEFPVVERMLDAARRSYSGPVSPETLITVAISLGLGFLVFSPYARQATRQDDDQWQRTQVEFQGLVAGLIASNRR